MTRTETTTVIDASGMLISETERKEYTLAELKELDGDGYDRALEHLSRISHEYDWWDATLDSETEYIADKYGITYNPKNVTFDLDRGSFFCFGKTHDVDDRKILRLAGVDLRTKAARDIIDTGLVLGTRHYGGSRMSGWIGFYAYEDIPSYIPDDVADAIRQVLTDAENEMLKTLRDEDEYLSSEEYLLELAEINDYWFYENGTPA